MKKDKIQIGGLSPLPYDGNDFKLGAIIDLPKLSELPKSFVIGSPDVVNQRNTDFCASAASCAVSEIQEGVPLAYEWLFAVAKTGDVESYGCDLRTICKVHVKNGVPKRKDVSLSLENNTDPYVLRRIENYPPELFQKALEHKKGSYFSVIDGDTDWFDDIKRSIWYFRDKKCGVLLGVMWNWSLQQVYMDTTDGGGGG
jgi:hypothetical protein